MPKWFDDLKENVTEAAHGIKHEVKASLGAYDMPVRSMAGMWHSPMCIELEAAADGSFRAAGMGMVVTVEKLIMDTQETSVVNGSEKHMNFKDPVNKVTLTIGATQFSGVANYEFNRVRWDNGAVWTKHEGSERFFGESSEEASNGLLSTRSADVLIDKINEAVDIPIATERQERKGIKYIVDKVNAMMTQALHEVVSPWVVDGLVTLLDDSQHTETKSESIRQLLKANLSPGLVRDLNDKIDIPLVHHDLEEIMIRKVVKEFLKYMVERCVLSLDRASYR